MSIAVIDEYLSMIKCAGFNRLRVLGSVRIILCDQGYAPRGLYCWPCGWLVAW